MSASLVSSSRRNAYDPLTAPGPGEGLAHAPSYWAATADAPPPDEGPLSADREVEVAVVGAGYTGLACAYHLARDHGVPVAVLEANRIGWGCSGRNGSFARAAYGRLAHRGWIDRFGIDRARAMLDEAREGLDHLRMLIARHDIACDLRHGATSRLPPCRRSQAMSWRSISVRRWSRPFRASSSMMRARSIPNRSIQP